MPIAAASQDELIFASVDQFPPYAWQQDDVPKGIDVEIIQSLGERTGLPIKVVLMPGKRVLSMLENGKVDGAFAAFKTAKRQEYAVYLDPPLHYSIYRLYVKKGDEFPFRDIRDLHGQSIGKNSGFHISEAFTLAESKKLIDVYDAKSMEQSIKMLEADRLDTFVGNEQEVSWVLKNIGLSDKIVPLRVPIRDRRGGHLMISKAAQIDNKKDVMRRLSEALQEMKADGTFDAIYSKYLE